MVCDIHIFLEVYNRDEQIWELTKGKHSLLVKELEEDLKAAHNDDEKYIQGVFDGELKSIKNNIERYSNDPEWIETFRDKALFAILSNIHNGEAFKPDFDGMVIPYVFNETNINEKAENNLPGNISQETSKLITDSDFHSLTIMYGNELDDVKELIDKNYEFGDLGANQCDIAYDKFLISFEHSLFEYEIDGYDENDMRFVIAYDN